MKSRLPFVLSLVLGAVASAAINHNPWVIGEGDDIENIVLTVAEDDEPDNSVSIPEDSDPLEISLECSTSCSPDVVVSYEITADNFDSSYIAVRYDGSDYTGTSGTITIPKSDFEGADGAVPVTVRLIGINDDGSETELGSIDIEPTCGSGDDDDLGSVDSVFSIGTGNTGLTSGNLSIHSDGINPEIYLPYYLERGFPDDDYDVVYSDEISGGRFVLTDYNEPANLSAPEAPDVILETPALSGGGYFVWLRMKASDAGGDSIWVSHDAEEDFVARAPSGGEWGWVRLQESAVSLASGDHDVRLKLRDAGVGLDSLILTDDAAFTPSGAAPELPGSGESHLLEIEDGGFDPVFFDELDEATEATGQLSTTFADVGPADYDLWLRVRSTDGARLRLFWDEASTGDEIVPGTHSEWAWIKVEDYVAVDATGDYGFVIELPGPGIDIDAVILTDDSTLTPSGVTQPPSDPGTFWLEGESMTAASEIETVTGEDPLEVSDGAYVTKSQALSDLAAVAFRTDLNANRTVDAFARLRFPLDFESNGQHYLWLRVRTPFSGRDSVWLSTSTGDGADREDVPLHLDASGDSWQWLRVEDPSLDFSSQGRRNLALRFREGGVHFDRVVVTTDDAFAPSDPDDQPSSGSHTAFEAENAGTTAPFHARFSMRQIRGSDTLVDIVALASPEQGYRMDRYFIDAGAEPDSATGLYETAPLGDPYASVTVRNPDPYDHSAGTGSHDQLEITRSAENTVLYTYDPSLGDWTLSTGGGLRLLEREEHLSSDGLTRTVLHTVRGPDDSIVDRYAEVHRTYGFGERLIQRIRHPESIALQGDGTLDYGAGDPIVDTWEYHEEGLGRAGRLNYHIAHDGDWTTYEYDDRGRTTKMVSRYLDSDFDDEANSRVVAYDFSDPGVDETGDVRVTARVETVKGVEVSRRYSVDVRNQDGHRVKQRRIEATVPGAAWNASSNLETVTTYTDPGGAFPGRIASVVRPDGTGATYEYAHATEAFLFASEGSPVSVDGIVTTEHSGALDSNSTVVDGRETESFRAVASGTTLRRVARDIATGLELDRTDVLDVDDFGRAVLTAHGDGSTTEREYAEQDCGCGPDKIVSETDRRGITTAYGYDALGRRTSTTRLGVTETRELDAQGRTIRTTRGADGTDRIVSETDYDLAGRVVERRAPGPVTDGSLVATTTDYIFPSEGGEVVTTTHPDGATEIRTSYPDGQTATVLGTAVAPVKMDYGTFTDGGESGLFTRQIRLLDDPLNAGQYLETEWSETRSVMGRRVATLYPDGASETVAYDDAGRIAEQKDADGVTTRFAYDDRGRRTVTAVKLENTPGIDYANDRVTEQEFDVIQKTADLGEGDQTYTFQQTKTYLYGEGDDATTGGTLVSTSEQEVFGRGSLQTDASGATRRSYRTLAADGDWEEVSVQPSGAYTVQSYVGGLLDATESHDSSDTLLHGTTYGYDAFNRRETVTDSRTGATSFAYYDNDQVRETTAPDPDGILGPLVTLVAYDDRGREIERTLPDASTVYSEYDSRGNLTKTYGSQQNPVEYTYDAQGRQKTMTTWQDFDESTGSGISGDATTTWIYDSQRGWLDRKEYDDGQGTDYTYTDGGRLASRTWARGITTNYAYNLAGDLAAVDYDDAGATPDVRYAYTRTGRQSVVEDGQFAAAAFAAGDILGTVPALDTTRYTYDYEYTSEFQVETETVGGLLTADAVLTRSYEDGTEPDGLPGRSAGYSLSTDGGSTSDAQANYAYDNAGRLKTVEDGSDTFTYGYLADTRNQLETMTGPVHTVTYAYESGRNAMTVVENEKTAGTPETVSRYEYAYNELGQRETREQSGDAIGTTNTDTFSYDDLGQVTGSVNDVETTAEKWNPSYNFDMIGNRDGDVVDINGTTAYTPDLLNQYTQVSGLSSQPSYDEDGNLEEYGSWTYTWNGENRLVKAENSVLSLSIDFEYDYQGRLVKKDDGTDLEVYLYDDWNRIAKYVNGSHSKSYLWGMDLSGSMQGAGGVGGLLKEGNRYPAYDANGNIVQKLNSSGGADMAVAYDPFGNAIDGVLVGDYGFSTKPLVDELDFYYYGFRYYDPVTGRWPSRDPIEERGGLNLYGFVGNDPILKSDNKGLMAKEITGVNPGGTIESAIKDLEEEVSSALKTADRDIPKLTAKQFFESNAYKSGTPSNKDIEKYLEFSNETQQVFTEIKTYFDSGNYNIEACFTNEIIMKHCDPGDQALMVPGKNIIYFCPDFTTSLVQAGVTNASIRTHVHELSHLSSDTDDNQNFSNEKLKTWPKYADFWEVVAGAAANDRVIEDLNFTVNQAFLR